MALGTLLEISGAEKKKLGALPGGPGEIDGRKGGGKEEVREAPFAGHGPWGAPLSKNCRLETTTNTRQQEI